MEILTQLASFLTIKLPIT